MIKKTLLLLALAAFVLAIVPTESESQTKVLRKVVFAGRVTNSTVDSTIGLDPRNLFRTFDPTLANTLPDSIKLVRVVKGDTAKFESRVYAKPFSTLSTNPFRYAQTVIDTITRATPGSTTDSTVVATLTRATSSGKVGYAQAGELGYKLKALTGNGILPANANYVTVFLEFYYSNK